MNKLFQFSIATSIYLFLLFSVSVIQSCGPRSEEVVQNYPTGEVSRRHTEINGKKEGKMIEYYKDGKIKGERLFKNDIQVGKSVFYYPTGEIKEVQYYEDGKMQGGDTVFYESGHPKFLRTFHQGLLDGYIRKWDTNDSLIYEARYAGDTLVEVKGQVLHPDSLDRR
jgi:antitoxin component YwqK of YwqJK toxin-antitoxin module